MRMRHWFACGAMLLAMLLAAAAQTRKPLTNSDILNMTKQGFDSSLIIKSIQTSDVDFDVSPQALIDLKAAGVSQDVMDAMMTAEAKHSPAPAPAPAPLPAQPTPGALPAANPVAMDTTKPICAANGCLLREGTEVTLKFVNALTSKTAKEGDPVEFVLADDVKVGDSVVIKKDAHATATVSNAKKAGMMGKPGELNVTLNYLDAADSHIRLRGTKGREGESKTGATVALTVIFGPIGLIKHGKNVEIAAGTPLTAYIDQDVWLPPLS